MLELDKGVKENKL